MRRSLIGLFALLSGVVTPALGQFFTLGTPSSGTTALNVDSLIIAAPKNDASIGILNTFTNATQVGNFYGTSAFVYQNAVQFFAGSHAGDATFGVIRIGEAGSRARIIGAWVCEVGGIGTECETAGGAATTITALKAVAATGTLQWVQDGIAESANVGDLSGITTLSAAASIVNTAIHGAYSATGAVGATLAASSTAPATCPGVVGTVAAGQLNVTAVTTNCLYAGGNLQGPIGGSIIMGQTSGTPNGIGVYAISTPASATSLTPYICNTCTLNYTILTVGTVGSTDTIKNGQGLYDSGPLTDSGVYGQLTACSGISSAKICTYTFPSSCVGTACAGTTWVVGSADPNQQTVASEAMTTTVCRLSATKTVYTGTSVNTSRFWIEQNPYCTAERPQHTLSMMTSGSDNLATIMGWSLASTGLPNQNLPYSGPWLSPNSEAIGADPTSYTASLQTWLAYTYNNVPGMTAVQNFQFWWDPDQGLTPPTRKNAVASWFAANAPAYVYARVWGDYSYAQANYALNTPYGLPICAPGSQVFTVSGTQTLDYCENHDYYLIGAAGSSGPGGTGASSNGGIGASGNLTKLVGLTTDSCCVAATVQVGVAGGGHTGGNDTALLNWPLLATGTSLTAFSGGNASGTTSGAITGCVATQTFIAGTYTTFSCFNGATGATPSATSGAGGAGGSAAGSLVGTGKQGGAGTGAGGGGGGGTSAAGSVNSANTGGAGGLNTDGSAGGAGGTNVPPPAAGTAPGGGGGGGSTININSAAGAHGEDANDFTTLTHPCSSGGPGGGGGGGGGNKAATGTQSGGAGGRGGNYGGSGGGGGGLSIAGTGAVGVAGVGAGGYVCIVGY